MTIFLGRSKAALLRENDCKKLDGEDGIEQAKQCDEGEGRKREMVYALFCDRILWIWDEGKNKERCY